jgi:hypothetical protein
MDKVKFYALVCRNMKAVTRHVKTIAKEDLVIVINSLDEDFVSDASTYCAKNEIEYYITASDGTPSKGKNSVLDLFADSENDYMVLVDGDDFITPHGYWTYKELAKSPKAPDVVALEYQFGIYKENGYHWSVGDLETCASRSPTIGVSDTQDADKVHGWGNRCFYQEYQWWQDAISGKLITEIEGDEFSAKLADVHQRWAAHCYKYISNWESHLRLVWFSKEAIRNNRFDLDFTVGEDTLFYLKLKKQALVGDFVMRHMFEQYPTYVYDTRVEGIVQQERHALEDPEDETSLVYDLGWYNWLHALVVEYDKYEEQGIMDETGMPLLKVKTHDNEHDGVDDDTYHIVWPEGYRPDTRGLVGYIPNKRIYL